MSSVIIGMLNARVVLITMTHKNIEFVRNSSREQKYLVKWSLVNILFISTFTVIPFITLLSVKFLLL